MKGDAKVVDFLNKALRHELTAVNQYWLHYRLLDNWGYKDLAKQWRKESIEEMEHADKLVVRIIFLEGFPNLQHCVRSRQSGSARRVQASCLIQAVYRSEKPRREAGVERRARRPL
jgi:bacterioferritin